MTNDTASRGPRALDYYADPDRTYYSAPDDDHVHVNSDGANEAFNALLVAATGLTPYSLEWYLRNSTSLSSREAYLRLCGDRDWTVADLLELAVTWDVPTTRIIEAIDDIAIGNVPEDAVLENDLDRRPYIGNVEGGEAK